MKSSYTTLIHSKYFSPAFNSAIFDGPIRIYFAQFHESLALKVYFLIQQKLAAEVVKAKEISKTSGSNILIMVYPTEESFLMSFEGEEGLSSPLKAERWEDDVIIGLRGPIADEQLDSLIDVLKETILNWNPQTQTPTYTRQPEL